MYGQMNESASASRENKDIYSKNNLYYLDSNGELMPFITRDWPETVIRGAEDYENCRDMVLNSRASELLSKIIPVTITVVDDYEREDFRRVFE